MPDAENPDLLSKISDARVLNRIVQEIDTNKDHTLQRSELAKWILKHADELIVEDRNFGKDLKTLGPSALTDDGKGINVQDYIYKDGPNKGKIDQDRMRARVDAQENANLLLGESNMIVETLKNALDYNKAILDQTALDAKRPLNAEEKAQIKQDAADAAEEKAKWAVVDKLYGGVMKGIIPEEKRGHLDTSKPAAPLDPAVQEIVENPANGFDALQKKQPSEFEKKVAGLSKEMAEARKAMGSYTLDETNAPTLNDLRSPATPAAPNRGNGHDR